MAVGLFAYFITNTATFSLHSLIEIVIKTNTLINARVQITKLISAVPNTHTYNVSKDPHQRAPFAHVLIGRPELVGGPHHPVLIANDSDKRS